jgi:hypothetical protein
MTGTGRLHGFESHAEQRLLLALDFLGAREVISQPHRMRFESAAGRRLPGLRHLDTLISLWRKQQEPAAAGPRTWC